MKALEDPPLLTVSASEQETFVPCKLIQGLMRSTLHKVIMTVPLESSHTRRKRHLVIVSAPVTRIPPPLSSLLSRSDLTRQTVPASGLSRDKRFNSARVKMDRNSPTAELDYCLLGVDSWKEPGITGEEEVEVATIGFVSKVLWGTTISLDGDGGFGVHVLQRHFIFKPLTLQCLWTTIQTLHAISARLKPKRNSMLVDEWDWVVDYQEHINSPQSCINEWNEMPDLLSRRPMSPDELTILSRDAADAETKKSVIRAKLREIMKTVDLDDITSKSIRLRLEEDLEQKLDEFKGFIDEEILLILGQMDPASRIFDFLYLGSEWNASNLEELNSNGITHILNVTREIDNFFPAVFKYLNIREYDVEETDLLKYWDETFNFIHSCVQMSGKVLVHCKMGISRSASTVCAFAMKYFGWSLDRALSHTKERRSIVNPNNGFRNQLRIYEGILGASGQRNNFRKIHRSKSEGSVKKSGPVNRREDRGHSRQSSTGSACVLLPSDIGQRCTKKRPASWSPPEKEARALDLGQGGDQDQDTTVSDTPVDLFEQNGETDLLLRNLGNFPRHSQNRPVMALADTGDTLVEPSPLRDPGVQVQDQGDTDVDRLDTSGAEELSVKTLADMFDFRLGEQ